jgi:Mg2+/citrate symporter
MKGLAKIIAGILAILGLSSKATRKKKARVKKIDRQVAKVKTAKKAVEKKRKRVKKAQKKAAKPVKRKKIKDAESFLKDFAKK